MPDLQASIIMLAHNKSRHTRLALTALLETNWNRVQVILVDNGSTDNTRTVFHDFEDHAHERGWTADLLLFDENIGAVAGRNRAMEMMQGELIVFMDNDIVVGMRSWLRRLARILAADPAIGVLGPKIVFAEPPHNIQCAGCVVCRGGRVDFRGRGRPFADPEFNRRTEVQALISACWIMPRRVVDQVGMLDMRFHPVQFEDIDYCYRVREAGYKAVYTPEVYFYHFENVTTDGTPSLNYRYLTVKNGLKFKRKWHHMFSRENGPDDSSVTWQDIPPVRFADVGELPMID